MPKGDQIEFSYCVARDGQSFWYTARRTYDEAKALADSWGNGAYVVKAESVTK